MKTCELFEIEISALIDGECPPDQLRQTVDHLAQCDSCMSIYREMRDFQGRVDQTPLSPDGAVVIADEPAKSAVAASRLPSVPRWAWPIAAILLVSLGLTLTGNFPVRIIHDDPVTAENLITVQLEENKGQMTEDRFLELALELLTADRLYQRSMAEVLHRAWNTDTRSEGSGNSPIIGFPSGSPTGSRLEGGSLDVASPEPAS